MTVAEKLQEIELHFNYWIGEFVRKELTTNNVRIIAESICKAVILTRKTEITGTQITLGRNSLIPKKRTTPQGIQLNFEDLIQTLEEEACFKNRKDIFHYFKIIQNRTNPSSHSKNSKVQNTTEDDLMVCMDSILHLLKWFYNEQVKLVVPSEIEKAIIDNKVTPSSHFDNLKWTEFSSMCGDFDKKRFQYILVSPEILSDQVRVVQAFCKIPWRLVMDFNPKTDEQEIGLLRNFEKQKGSGYRKIFTINDKPDFDPLFNHYWFLANGQGSIVPTTNFKSWRTKYRNYLSENLYKAFIKGSRSRTRVVVMVDIDPDYAELIVSELNRIEEDNLKFILCRSNGKSYESICEDWDNVEQVSISVNEIADGINSTLDYGGSNDNEVIPIEIPHKNERNEKILVEISKEHYDYLYSLGIELVFNRIDKIVLPSEDRVDFYKGGKISWVDLAEQKDIERSCYVNMAKRIESELEKNKLNEVELVHGAGGGGTTVARRIAYDLSKKYPTIVLRKFEPKKLYLEFRFFTINTLKEGCLF